MRVPKGIKSFAGRTTCMSWPNYVMLISYELGARKIENITTKWAVSEHTCVTSSKTSIVSKSECEMSGSRPPATYILPSITTAPGLKNIRMKWGGVFIIRHIEGIKVCHDDWQRFIIFMSRKYLNRPVFISGSATHPDALAEDDGTAMASGFQQWTDLRTLRDSVSYPPTRHTVSPYSRTVAPGGHQ